MRAAEQAPEFSFVLGGEGWGGKPLPPNVRWIGHVGTGDHNRINCSARMVLNINRESMASVGFSPPTRVFEAAGAGACLITDDWAGIEEFFEPGCEILVARDAQRDRRICCGRWTPSWRARSAKPCADARCKNIPTRCARLQVRQDSLARVHARGALERAASRRAVTARRSWQSMKIVVFGLSITSSWGNGHGTTFRALLRALHARGHHIVFFEKDVEWYASNRDLPEPDFCKVQLCSTTGAKFCRSAASELKDADVAMVGSYFPDGIAAIDEMLDRRRPREDVLRHRHANHRGGTCAPKGATDYLDAPADSHRSTCISASPAGRCCGSWKQRFGARRAVPLYCSFDPQQYRRFGVNRRFACDLSYMGTYAPDRQPKIDELLCAPARLCRNSSFIVAGPQYPSATALADATCAASSTSIRAGMRSSTRRLASP